ncbi:MAG TPA: AAA family ATPase, partial [Dehalococcoidia bacterium]
MRLAPDTSITCPFVIGRSEYLGPFERVVDAICAGQGRLITIAGEAGIGKSRLVRELQGCAREAAKDSGIRVLEGRCFEHDASLPYAPLLDLLRSLLARTQPDDQRELLGSELGVIARLLPEIRPGEANEESPEIDPEQERRRLFRALMAIISRMAREQPLLLIVEDLHWSDDTSLDFLLQLARAAVSERVLIVLTYRSDEVRPALGHFLAGLDRERLTVDWPLQRLTAIEVGEMITGIFELSSPPAPEFVEPIHELTEGNPFFIEELLKSLIAAGDIFYAEGAWDRKPISEIRIPRSVQDAVRQRTARISEAARQMLTYAAVAGRRFDFGLLARVSGRTEIEMLPLLKEVMSAQLVIEESADRFAFRHALTQQTVYSGLLARERRILHREIAEAIEAAYGDAEAHLGDLAHHYYEGAEWAKAFDYACRSATRAQALYAPAEAVTGFTRAIEAAGQQDQNADGWVYRARGSAYESLGSFDLARADYECALRIARAADDAADEWEALIRLGFLWTTRDYERTGDFFRRALDLARAADDPSLLGRSLNRLGNWLVNTGRPAEGRIEHEAALEIFRTNGNEHGIAETLDLLGMANGICGDLIASVDNSRQAIERLRALRDDTVLASSLATHMIYGSRHVSDTQLSPRRPIAELRVEGEEAIIVARRSGSLAALSFAEWVMGATLGTAGQFSEGLAHNLEGLRIAEEIDHKQWLAGVRCSAGQISLFMLDPGAAVQHLELGLPIAREVKSQWWVNNISSYLALAYIQLQDFDAASAVIAAASPPHDGPLPLAERRIAWARAELALARGEADMALASAEALLASAPGAERLPAGDPQRRSIPRLLL